MYKIDINSPNLLLINMFFVFYFFQVLIYSIKGDFNSESDIKAWKQVKCHGR